MEGGVAEEWREAFRCLLPIGMILFPRIGASLTLSSSLSLLSSLFVSILFFFSLLKS